MRFLRKIKQPVRISLILLVLFSGFIPSIYTSAIPILQFRTDKAYADSQTFTSSGTFNVPAGVSSVTVKMWGGGAAGNNGKAAKPGDSGGGGGGGAYTECTLSVTPSSGYSVTVGAATSAGSESAGNSSTMTGDNGTCTANGGSATIAEAGGAGGVAQTVTGVVTSAYAGGAGANGAKNASSNGGGGGGEGSGTTANGNNGATFSGTTGGAGGTGTDGGDGGSGGNSGAAGVSGTTPAGGGGGAGSNNDLGGGGARGEVTLEWVVVTISVQVTDAGVAYGTVALDSSVSTLSGELNDMQTATNDGNITEDFNIKGQDASGGGCTWTLAATTSSDQYIHEFCNDTDNDCTTPPTNYTALTTTYQTLKTGISTSGTVDFQLRITTPSSSTCFNAQSVDVTVQAVQP